MARKSYENAINVFQENHGILRTSQAKRLGVHEPVIQQMYQEGLLVKEAHGLYRLANMPRLSNPDLVQIAVRVPAAVFCLISALNYHNLTTQIPHKVYIALPRDVKAPRIDYPPIDITYLSEKAYLAGIEDQLIDGITTRIYDREKTVADCFKFRGKIGVDIAVEALRDYMKQPGRNIPILMQYSKINRVSKTIEPYLQALQ